MTNEQKDIRLLQEFFDRNAYLRFPNVKRRIADGGNIYKKGYEVRLVLLDEDELETVLRMLYRLEFVPGKPFIKSSRIIQPIYGRAQVEHFCQLVGYDWEARLTESL